MSGDIASALGNVARPGGDGDPWTEAVVLSVDGTARRIEVSLDDDDNPIDVPVLGFIEDYTDGQRVALMRRPTGYWAMGVMGGSRVIAELPSRGTVSSVGGSTVTVSTSIGSVVAGSVQSAVISSGDPVVLMWDQDGRPWVVGRVGVAASAPSTPTGLTLDRNGSSVLASWSAVSGATQYRIRWSQSGGAAWTSRVVTGTSATVGIAQGTTLTVQVQALNSGGSSSYTSSQTVTYPQSSGSTEVVTTTLRASDSGTYRVSTGKWNDWNRGRDDYPRSLHQGSRYGSGVLRGWAGYGTRIRDLGATEITRIRLRAERGSWGNRAASERLQVQGSSNGTRPSGNPSSSGVTATTNGVTPGRTATVDLPESMCEAMRIGDVRGLVAVGSDVSSWLGTGDSMSLEITYRRPR